MKAFLELLREDAAKLAEHIGQVGFVELLLESAYSPLLLTELVLQRCLLLIPPLECPVVVSPQLVV